MTARRAVTTRRADEDIEHAVSYYLEQGAMDAALSFVDALESAKALMCRHPSVGSSGFAAELGIPELRALALQTYPYIVFYTDDADVVRVHRVLHSSRDIPARFTQS
ncbi:toxin ParE1/3/4 [Microbacterium sp. W4I4]|uniref:type II toxin-antitoxin system RelE/ParE family toxin n=1 Tax=Microbacterium sp. W4I4 TaxID=3042295 RepID=UPI00278643DA|nr:type II toxin-antitoxin system RelE/ParE family toxin [Microbacterium sp. W4I4]MDQ0613935.1 toxin ParE1/3/4 [Microbacterium sp. W4I4]